MLFAGIFHASTLHRFCIDLESIVDTFLHAENLKFYLFLNSFVAFRLFRKGMKNRRCLHPFWHHFIQFWHDFQYFLGIDFSMLFWMTFVRFLIPKMLKNGVVFQAVGCLLDDLVLEVLDRTPRKRTWYHFDTIIMHLYWIINKLLMELWIILGPPVSILSSRSPPDSTN